MQVALAYGESSLPLDLPNKIDVIEPRALPRIPNPEKALSDALRKPIFGPPLNELVKEESSIVVVISDSTRPAPNREMVKAVLTELANPIDRIEVLVATGLHRPTSDAELERMLGADLKRNLRIFNHDARATTCLRKIGTTSSGRPVLINRRYLDADVRITLGLIEPHFFAGFSGGAKLVMPGIAGEASILYDDLAPPLSSNKVTLGRRLVPGQREIGSGRPTKRERRAVDRLQDR